MGGTYDSATLVEGTTDVYDVASRSNSFLHLLDGATNVTEVLGAESSNVSNMTWTFCDCSALTTVSLFDTSNVTNMAFMFRGCCSLTGVPLFNTSKLTDIGSMFDGGCSSLSSVPLFDTSNVTNMTFTFQNCTSLTSVPLFDTSKAINTFWMFENCYNVQSGALALYQQASTQANPPVYHMGMFGDCGRDTETGSAELAQIPSDWK